MKLEIWKDIPNYEGYYQVSNLGRIKSLEIKLKFGRQTRIKPESILRTYLNNSGYVSVDLYKDTKRWKAKVHKIIAITFLEKINNKNEVNHKDLNKLNNCIENLEWCNRSENQQHMTKYKRIKSLKELVG